MDEIRRQLAAAEAEAAELDRRASQLENNLSVLRQVPRRCVPFLGRHRWLFTASP